MPITREELIAEVEMCMPWKWAAMVYADNGRVRHWVLQPGTKMPAYFETREEAMNAALAWKASLEEA